MAFGPFLGALLYGVGGYELPFIVFSGFFFIFIWLIVFIMNMTVETHGE